MGNLRTKTAEDKVILAQALELARTIKSKNLMGLGLAKEAIHVHLDAGGPGQTLQVEERNQILLTARALEN
jgi:hypothetical protein